MIPLLALSSGRLTDAVYSGYNRRIQAEIKALKHNMDENPEKVGPMRQDRFERRTQKEACLTPQNGEKFSATEKRTISYRGYTFKDWQLLSHELCSDIAD